MGFMEGNCVGIWVGSKDGDEVGPALGSPVGREVGIWAGLSVGKPDGASVWWLHAPGCASSIAMLSAAEVTNPFLHRLASLSHPHMNATPLAETVPSQSLLHVTWRHGSVVGDIDGS